VLFLLWIKPKYIPPFLPYFLYFSSTFIDPHSKYRVSVRGWVFPKQKMSEFVDNSHCTHTLDHLRGVLGKCINI